MTVRLDRVQACCMAMMASATSATPLWAPAQDFARSIASGSVMTARIVRGPLIRHTRVDYSAEPVLLRWTAAAPVDDSRIVIALTGAQWYYDVPPGDTAAEVRDAVLELFDNAEFLPGVEITAAGAASIDFDADGVPGLLWGHQVYGPGHGFAVTTALDCEVETANAECVVEFQAYGAEATDAEALLGALSGSLSLDAMKAIRAAWGVSTRGPMSEPANLTAVAGPRWESRAAARLPVAVRSYTARQISTVESLALELRTDTALAEIEVTL